MFAKSEIGKCQFAKSSGQANPSLHSNAHGCFIKAKKSVFCCKPLPYECPLMMKICQLVPIKYVHRILR